MRITDTHIYFFTGEDIFSNFAYAPFIYEKSFTDMFGRSVEKIFFEYSEQAYMYEKCLFFGQHEMAHKCVETNDPRKVKNIGRSIPNFDHNKWYEVSFDKMYDVCLSKFTYNETAKKSLIESGDKILVEASPYDLIWGVGIGQNDDDILQEEKWKGENRLGNVLMKVRKNIK